MKRFKLRNPSNGRNLIVKATRLKRAKQKAAASPRKGIFYEPSQYKEVV